LCLCAAFGIAACLPLAVVAAEGTTPVRPLILSNRWQEDWSALFDPTLRVQPMDRLKYLPFEANSPSTYLSFGVNLRERFESSESLTPGATGTRSDGYLLDRIQLHADARLGSHWQVFVQLEDARTLDKAAVTPVDRNPLDLRQAFVAYQHKLGDGELKLRVGRQEMSFDLQRFISSRNGPNVRQAFDALWINYEIAAWRLIGFWSHPVQYRSADAFDDVSNRRFQYGGLRFERQLQGAGELSGYYSRWIRKDVHYLDGNGNESRRIYDLRYGGKKTRLDWDVEAMAQRGTLGTEPVRAWALGAHAGYTVDTAWTARWGLQFDAASGDRHPGDGRLDTFNPLFPNGSYFTLGGYTGYSNLIHVKPSLTLHPAPGWSLMLGWGLQWRQTTGDGVYLQSGRAVPGTAGLRGRWTGMYGQGRVDWAVSRNLSLAVEAVHFEVGKAVREAGGRDGNYLGVEARLAR
jgi:hypothetical protein